MRSACAAVAAGAVMLFAGVASAGNVDRLERRIRDLEARIARQDKMADEMKHLADKDALTGMNNKRLYFPNSL